MIIKSIFLIGSRHTGVQRPALYGSISTLLSKPLENSMINKNTNILKKTFKTDSKMLYSSIPNNHDKIKNQNKVEQGTTPTNEAEVLTGTQKFKKAIAEYGTTVIVFHISISLISLGSCYLLVSSGLDVNEVLLKFGLNEWIKGNAVLVSNAGTFAVAYAIHKVFAPVRMGITLASVPFIVKYLRQKGILKK